MKTRKKTLLAVILTLALSLSAFLFGCAAEVSFADLPEKTSSISDQAIDTSNADNGTIKAHAISDKKSKLVVRNGRNDYVYLLPSDGSEMVVPLNLGDGTYEIEVCEHQHDTKYEVQKKVKINVSDLGLKPYLSSNRLCDFTPESGLVQHADYLCQNLTTDSDKLNAIVSWVVENIDYDTDKANELSGEHDYYPSARETYNAKSGICYDYASLTAAMLRSQNIPTKIMTGTHTPTGVYHSWNEVLIDGEWIAIDTTIAAHNGSNPVVDKSLYEIRYTY